MRQISVLAVLIAINSGSLVMPAQADADTCLVGPKLVPTCGVLWGTYTPGGPAGVTDVESTIGRPFDVVKRYHDFSNSGAHGVFPNAYEQGLGGTGTRTLFFAWVSQIRSTGYRIPWSAIDSGYYDESVIEPAAERVQAWGRRVFIDFDHEADGRRRSGQGTPEEFRAAYRHIKDVFDRVGATNAVWVWVTSGWKGNWETMQGMYPGDEYVDWLGWDPYNYYACREMDWMSPGETVGRWYDWLQQHGMGDKPFMIAEYGTLGDAGKADAKAQWYRNLPGALEKYPAIKAVVQFNTNKRCDFRVSTDQQVLDAFAAAATDDYINLH